MSPRSRWTSALVAALVAAALAVTAAVPAVGAPTKPAASTGTAANVAFSSALLNGTVNADGSPTTFFFEYGPTAAYGAVSATIDAGSGSTVANVAAPIVGLAPSTTYHYRIVARNGIGQATGSDRTFRTPVQPLGATLGAMPNPVPFGSGATLSGALTGTDNAGRPVVLQANPFPYTQGFASVGNAQVTDAQGAFAFALLAIGVNTQYRVLLPDRPGVVSPIVSVGVAVRVGTTLSTHRVHTGHAVRFSGTLRPVRDGTLLSIQRLAGHHWVTVAHTVARHTGSDYSRYATRVRIHHGGSYRVYARIVDGAHVSGAGTTVHITRR
jgi:hypothetical protein